MSDLSMTREFTTGPLTLEEMIKIMSLLDNPPEASEVRKALRFYQFTGDDMKWGDTSASIKTLLHYACPQDKWELGEMLKIVAKCSSVLEIGSSFGGTLKRMASVMQKGSLLVSVDMPADATPAYLNPVASLKETCRQIAAMGGNVELFIGDSHSQQVVNAVENFAPYDFIFIDGDHSYEGMKADWENYGKMGRIVAFHDINGPLEECKRCWAEIKASELHTEEFISPDGKNKFGIGVVYRE